MNEAVASGVRGMPLQKRNEHLTAAGTDSEGAPAACTVSDTAIANELWR